MLESFFAGIGIFLASIFGGAQADFLATVPSQPAAVVAASSNEDAPASVATSTQSAAPLDTTRAIVNSYITQPVIERIVQPASLTGYVTHEELASQIEQVTSIFGKAINGMTYPSPSSSYSDGGVWNAIALTNRIENLNDVTISNSSITNPTITGGSIDGASIGAITADSFSIGTLTGPLRATAGVVAASLIDLTADVTNALPAANGGTGTTSLSGLIRGNGTSPFSAAVAGTDYQSPITAGAGLSFSGSTLNSGWSISTDNIYNSYYNLSGNIGIGTTSPWKKLSIYGDISLTGGLFDSDSSAGSNGHILQSTGAGIRWVATSTLGISSADSGSLITGFLTATSTRGTATSSIAHALWVGGGTPVATTGLSPIFAVGTSTIPTLRVDPANNVIIQRGGTSLLSAAGYSGYMLRIGDRQSGNHNLVSLYDENADSSGPLFQFQKVRPSSELSVGDDLGRIQFVGTTAGGSGLAGAEIMGEADTGWTGAGDAPGRLRFLTSPDGTASTVERMRITNAGYVGIATTSPWRSLSVTGSVGFDGLTGSTGAGSLCLTSNLEVVYNSGSDSCLSSTRATKHDINPLVLDALAQVVALNPVSFIYNNDASSTVRYGFIAEDTAAVDSHLATYNAQGAVSGIDDRSIISVVVKAIQQLRDRLESYFTRTEQLEARVAALEAQLAASAVGQSPAPSEEEEDASDTEPPTITINGNNPATLSVGDTYADLGATVTDNVDLNLGLHVFVGGTPMDQAVLDTSEPNEWHIHYVATDNAGNTATSTRTVIVEAPSIVPTDEPAGPETETIEEPEQEQELVTS